MPFATGEPLGIIACAAIARELVQLGRMNGWHHFKLYCLPADLHNRPAEIPTAVAAKIALVKRRHGRGVGRLRRLRYRRGARCGA